MISTLHLNPLNPEPFAARRTHLAEKMRALHPDGASIAIIPTAQEARRNGDAYYDFRPDSYFYYLTGFTEPEAVLVLLVDSSSVRSMVYCREKNLEREIWDGYRLGPEQAVTDLAVDEARSFGSFYSDLPQLLSHRAAIFAPLASTQSLCVSASDVSAGLNGARALARSGATAPAVQYDVYSILSEMRLRKDALEQECLRIAGKISALGHIRAMQRCRVGGRELDLEAELRYAFMHEGAQDVAYNTIVAAGANACVLHYRAGHTELRDGDLCLIDAGAEYACYAGDITRTFPVNGRFSKPQRAVYEYVLAAQKAAIDLTRAGVGFDEPHDAAVQILTQGLLDLGILNSNKVGSLEDAIAQKAYQPFYMHRTGHWLGLDVHDCGAYSVGQASDPADETRKMPIWCTLESGMALTIEPGLYIRPSADVPEQYWNIGIRIEDNAIVCADGCKLTTRDVPVEADEIERLMNAR